VNPAWFTVGAGIFQEEENREERGNSAHLSRMTREPERFARFLA
jgi:hypothetical protein